MFITIDHSFQLTSGWDPSPSIVNVCPDESDDRHEGKPESADVAQPVARPKHEPGQDQDGGDGEAVQKLKHSKHILRKIVNSFWGK